MNARERLGAALCVICGVLVLLLALPTLEYLRVEHEKILWLRSGASLPVAFVGVRAVYAHDQADLCSEALYRLDDEMADRIQRQGSSYLNGLGENRQGDTLRWESLAATAEQNGREGPSLSGGYTCFLSGPTDAWGAWPTLFEAPNRDTAYAAIDGEGNWLIIYPEERLAHFRGGPR